MSGERGSVTIWMVGLVAIVAVVCGPAVDGWHLFEERRSLAAVADAAALAATSAVDRAAWAGEGVPSLVPGEACALAAALVADAAGFVCRVDGPRVRVEVSREVGLVLLAPLHPDPVVVSARSEAEARPLP